ncbi:hypothetical protein Pelo_17484 [Pelomyxa schiedti]|nr:hypothetical protein Pelo_17484 [Pelomyxa schiedti]
MDGVANSSSQQPPQSPSPNATRCPMCRRPQPESPSQQGTAPFVLVPSCGHQPCPECADAIVAFEGISSPHLISSSAVPPRVETSACSAPASAASTCLPVGVGFEIWCTVCEGAREAKLEGSAGTPSSPATRMTVWPCLGLDDPVLERWAKRRRLMPRPEEAKLIIIILL